MRRACLHGRVIASALLAMGLVVPALAGGCDREGEGIVPPTAPTAGSGTTPDAGDGGAPPDGGPGGGPPIDAGVSAVRLGAVPNPLTDDAGEATAADRLAALLEISAVGARAYCPMVYWDRLALEGLGPLVESVNAARARGMSVLLTLAPVARHRDRRPAELAELAWGDPRVLADMVQLADDVVDAAGGDLYGLLLGHDVDVYADELTTERSEFVDFVAQTVAHVRTSVGASFAASAGLSFSGAEPSERWHALVEPGSVVAVSYHPGLDAPELPVASSVAKDLDTLITLASDRPVFLMRTGLTTEPSLGGSEDGQLAFLDGLFDALAARRSAIPLVCVHELHDRAAGSCEALAADLGEDPAGSVAAFLCQSGLRGADGTAKPSWGRFAQAAAAFASP